MPATGVLTRQSAVDPAAGTEDLIAQGQGLVRSLAAGIHRKLPRHIDMDDLVAYGQLGLVEAARDFDAARGAQFSTYAYYRIRGAIYDGLSKMSGFGRRHSETVRYEQMANETLRATAEEDDNRETASGETLAHRFRDVSWSLLVVYLAGRSRSDDTASAEAAVADPSAPTPLAAVIQRETSQRLVELIEGLPAGEATLIRAIYFEGLTIEQAGRKLGISKSWASRLHAKSLQRLARSLRLCGLGG
jgi:RNA polymerase sigma factor FliA